MMRRMLGAPLGGTTRGGHHGLESLALSLINPPNGSGGGGSCFPSSVTVALGEPGTPMICWACATLAVINQAIVNTIPSDRLPLICRLILTLPPAFNLAKSAWRNAGKASIRPWSDHLCSHRRRINCQGCATL